MQDFKRGVIQLLKCRWTWFLFFGALVIASLIIFVDKTKPTLQHETVAEAISKTSPTQLVHRSGEDVYQQVCIACHAESVFEAPRYGDKSAWASLIAEGYGHLIYEAIKGEDLMPPRGGDASLTDLEIAHAVAYMANAAGADFVSPQSEDEVKAMLPDAEKEHD